MPDPGTVDRTATMDDVDVAPSTVAPQEQAAPPQIPARYRVERELGRGASSVVLAARDEVLGRSVALKQLHLRAGSSARLLREARLSASLDHPHIVRIHEVDVDHGLLVMELLPGGTLAERIAARPLSGPEVIAVGRELALALAHAHRAGILHRDVKPSNVLFDREGRARLADFGIAATAGTASGPGGTRAYAAPEQLKGEATVASDLYGLGATLLAAATGMHPLALEGTPEAAVLRASGSPALARLIGRLLHAEPAARPASADAVVRALSGGRGWRSASIVLAVLAVASLVGFASWRAERSRAALEDTRSALARNDLVAAERALRDADPDDPSAVAQRVLLDWWNGRSATELVTDLDRALRGELPPDERALLEGLRLLGTHDLDRAAAHFDAYVADHPTARDGLYGAFEAHFHRGEGELASQLYDRIRAADPDFALGIEHALSHALATSDYERFSALLADSDAVPTAERVLWRARLELARGRPDAAAEAPARALRVRPDERTRSYALVLWTEAEVARGDRIAAREVAGRATGVPGAALLHALETLSPDAPLGASRRTLAERMAEHRTGSYPTTVAWLALELGLGERGDVGPARQALERVRHDDVRTRMLDLWLAERDGDRERMHASSASTSPEVVEAAAAMEAEAAGHDAEAATRWLRAAGRSSDVTLRALSWSRAAAAFGRAGDVAERARACQLLTRGWVPWSAFPLLAPCSAPLR